jgi:hypothetical protein
MPRSEGYSDFKFCALLFWDIVQNGQYLKKKKITKTSDRKTKFSNMKKWHKQINLISHNQVEKSINGVTSLTL